MITLVSCGYRYVYPDGLTIDRPDGAGNYAFVYFKNKSEVLLNGRRVIAEGDSYVLFRPSTPQYYRGVELPYADDWLHYEGDDLEKLLDELNFPLDTIVPASDPSLVSRSIMELHRVRQLGGPHKERIVDAELRALFMKLSNLQELSSLTNRSVRYFRQLAELRDELYNAPHVRSSVEQLAARVNLSTSYFQHLYKDLFGCSIVADMINGRLEYAKYLLKNSTLSVSAIAARCGYEHDTHFMRQFKKFVGSTPGRFKAGL